MKKRLIKTDSYPTNLSFGFIKKFEHFLVPFAKRSFHDLLG
ncbi:hypothetical protein CHCC20488_0761 [Bacillus paralicheniformis]|uniref:Uncharacterized protein n=1 Tax=Bacillus paralicheniformis TaxID=1648923 RepID=A0A7Z1B2D8_9BACI|nr:hypothetical protein SC10_B2orf03416 [Bacillus paralicheniformis]ETB72347.1 hypothetical protein A943_04830 [Bacillus sp. CPSM8]OLF89951.1 hypothetical protein B4121_3226 [Bacillus paralicheniformis]OLG07641.1 hypothetical protein B4125_1822 [Bacillus paralicheniformis]TWJ37481.1 hypothetical protein CHCC5027_0979 [Bacillus paralicheniformis]